MPPLDFDPFPQPTSRKEVGSYAAVWRPVQQALARRVIVKPLPVPRFVAGADCAFSKDDGKIHAAAVVWDNDDRKIIEVAHVTRALEAPYIGGYLSFREGPALVEVIRKLKSPFSVVCFDGQGVAHPRRCGLASHVGIALDVPSIGVAKSRLIGTHADPPAASGSTAVLMDGEEQIGVVLRTRHNVKPLYVSVGHQVDLPSAVAIVMACVTRYRMPEPTRVADIEVAKLKRSQG